MPTMPSAMGEPGGSCMRCTCIDAWSTVYMDARAHSARACQSPVDCTCCMRMRMVHVVLSQTMEPTPIGVLAQALDIARVGRTLAAPGNAHTVLPFA
eukprot:13092471-Alexandrium_andersonii.AAC.1